MDKLELDYLEDLVDDPIEFLNLHSLDEIDALLDMPVVLCKPPTASQTLTSEKISIRVPHHILSAMKHQARARGFPYQTFINLILGEYAAGRWKL